MKIAHIVENYYSNPFGGIATWTRRLIQYLDNNGFSNKVYAYNYGIPANIPNIVKATPNVRELIVYPYLGRKIISQIDGDYDIIHFASPLTTAHYRARSKTVISGHYIVSRQSRLLGQHLSYPYKLLFNSFIIRLFEQLEKAAYPKGDVIIVPREDYKTYLQEKYHIPSKRFSIIKWGVDTTIFKPTVERKKKENIALFVGRGTPAKGFDTFLKAAKNINGKLLAVASPIMKRERELLKGLKNVEIIYGLNDKEMAEVYNRCSVFIMPSLSESGPLTTIEAMACGLPVVCTTEGSAGAIKDGYNGYIIDFGDHANMAEKVNYLFKNRDVAHEFGQRNRAIVEKDHSIDKMCSEVKHVYDQIIDR